jgi:hypothetical protein
MPRSVRLGIDPLVIIDFCLSCDTSQVSRTSVPPSAGFSS